jgi:serine/threonine-protein kinase
MSEALSRLGKYELRGTLGKGAMGTVHDGWDPAIARRVAIKTVRLPDADDEEGQEALSRFRREAQAAGRLNHPNIVGVYDYGETEELAYIVMEFIDGRTLKHALDADERLAAADAIRLVSDILDGLAYSHALGVVHRDIKPANIMLTASGRAKIADFGIARIESSSLTQAGTVLGTPAYMSPEQFMGQVVDRRSDIYSTGVLLYQLLTGERPFEGSLTGIMHKALNTTPPRPSEISVTAPAALDAVVARAMARRPEDRFDTADAFALALRQEAAPATAEPPPSDEDHTIVARTPPAPPAPRPPPPRRRRLPVALGAAALLAVAGVAGIQLLAPSPPKASPPAPPPAKVVAAPPAPASVEASLDQALPAIACTLAHAETAPDRAVTLSGVAGAGDPANALRAAAKHAGAATIDDRVISTTGPYCGLLDVLRVPAAAGRAIRVAEADGKTVLADHQTIAVSITMPPISGMLHVTYVGSDGSVAQLVPGPGEPARTYQAGEQIVFGRPSSRSSGWTVGPPFGTDLVVVVASPAPLLESPLAANETVDAYSRALAPVMAHAYVGVLPLRTAEAK